MTDRHTHKPLYFRPHPEDRARLAAHEAAGETRNAILADALAAWLDTHPLADETGTEDERVACAP
jgi:hypothetical protein